MQRVLKKNYSLYVDYCSKRVKLCSGTLEDIDDFTTYFIDKNAIGKRLIKNESGEFLVYIESSRGKYYSPMYYNNRAILDKENFYKGSYNYGGIESVGEYEPIQQGNHDG